MGDIADMNDIERFMRSAAGLRLEKNLLERMSGKTIVSVRFINSVNRIEMEILLTGGEKIQATVMGVDEIRAEYENVLTEEYYKDYPNRKP